MKRLLYILIFLIAFMLGNCQYSFAQDSITLDRSTAESALKAIELVPALQNENNELRKLVKDLEAQKTTPCSVALTNAERLITVIPFGDPSDSKATIKARNEQRKLVKYLIVNSVKSQCDWKESPKWYLEILKFAPLAGAILLK